MSGGSIAKACALAQQGWYVVIACVLMTTQPFITMLSKNAEGSYDYLAISTTLVTEIVKFFISLTLYVLLPKTAKSHRMLRHREILLFAVPAFVYFVNNNLIFVILFYVNSTTFQILSSLKTVFTGLFFRIILKRLLSDVQAISILMLACGAAVSQFPVCPPCEWQEDLAEAEEGAGAVIVGTNATLAGSRGAVSIGGGVKLAGAWLGALVALLTCVLSAFGGVYSELLLKKDGQLHSIHLQNALLYCWGVLFNGLGLLINDRTTIMERGGGGIFKGYTPIVLLLIVNNSLVGLAISAILKFANNLVRVFAHTAAMLLTLLLETLFMGAPMSPQLATSITIVTGSAYLYNVHPAPKPIATASNLLRTTDEDASKATRTLRERDDLQLPAEVSRTPPRPLEEADESPWESPDSRTRLDPNLPPDLDVELPPMLPPGSVGNGSMVQR